MGRRTEPDIPVQALRDRWFALRSSNSLRPPVLRPIGPDVQLSDFPQDSRLQDFNRPPGSLERMTLSSHLRRDTGVGGHFGHSPGLPNRVRKGFLAIHVFAQLHGSDRDDGMIVVGSRDEDGIEIAVRVEQLSPIGVPPSMRIILERCRSALLVAVAERDNMDIGRTQVMKIVGTAAAGADNRDAKLFFRRRRGTCRLLRIEVPAAAHQPGRGSERVLSELTTAEEC